MRGKRFISAQESREGASLNESLLKWLTGGDLVRARRLYENSFEFDPTHKIWLATNHKPRIRGTDPAIWSRIKLIPFEISFEGREDRTLKSVLMAESSGILAWMVEGCRRWREEGLGFPETVINATRQYRDECDQVGRFIADCCVRDEKAFVVAHALYVEYGRWAKEAGEEVMTETAFGLKLTERGIPKKHTDVGNKYLGIGPRTTSSQG
jgi:putative DNA primase/helicase